MCGIAGILRFNRHAHVRDEELHQMCRAIIHRGPDDQGTYAKGRVGLGMRRLSIIDVHGGHQPVYNEDRTVSAVFNGEIYNYRELKVELEASGHRFYTNSDTEVIPHLYEAYGLDFVKKLRGMFAIALFDDAKQRLILARDRLGKKPLLYSVAKQQLLFASEVRALLAIDPGLISGVDPEALLYFFTFGYIPDPKSAYSDIVKLPAGHLLSWENGRITVAQYWDLPTFREDDPRTEDEWLEELEPAVAESVRIRLISDVPLGALLSGGVDSSTVVALMARAQSAPVKTFSIAFGARDFDEAEHARKVAARFGTEHHELTVHPDIGEALQKLTELLEEPFGDSSMLPTYYVSRLVRDYVTVALSGDGGDELFAGYDRYSLNLQRERYKFLQNGAGRLYRNRIFHRLPESTRGRRLAYNITLPFRDRYIDSISFLSPRRERQLFSDEFLEIADRYTPPEEFFQDIYDHAPATHLLSKLQYLDTKTYLSGDILPKVDRMSMAVSLEMRAPLLDHKIAELAARIPAQWKLRGGESKYLLKKLAERLDIPREVLYRPKKGFGVPLTHWFRNELKEEITCILTEPKTWQRGYFNRKAVNQMLEEHFAGLRDYSSQIWLLLIFELWHRNFLEARDCNPTAASLRPTLQVS